MGPWLLQVVFWVLREGGEGVDEGRGSKGEGRRAVQSSVEENYHFLSPLLSSPLADEGSCRWLCGWLLEVEDDGSRQG